jgi:hypothetical protein
MVCGIRRSANEKHPPEDQVEAQERKVLAPRDRIGNARWCQLYSVEMQEAYIIVQSIMQHH